MAQQTSSGVAVSMPFAADDGKDGDIVCSTPTGAVPCSKSMDATMIGVLVLSPAVSLEREATYEANRKPVISLGKAYVRVGRTEGGIKKGDPISSSTTPGLGAKAIATGYILGMSMEDVTFAEGEQEKLILVSLNIRPSYFPAPAKANLIQLIREGMEGTYSSPLSALRFLLAAVITLLSIGFGFLYFGHVARSGVEAIGRNPLAGRMIQLAVVFNVFLTIAIMGTGVGVSYFILTM